MKITRGIATVALLAAVASGCATASGSGDGSSAPPLQQAYHVCKDKTLDIGDAGHTLMIDTGSSGDIDGAGCVLAMLDTPDSVVTRMDNTTALMGSQTAEAGGFSYEWTYHPDNGLNVVITD